MRISQVGEAASKTSPEAPAAVSGVTWRDVKGIRGKIVHDYQAVDALARGGRYTLVRTFGDGRLLLFRVGPAT
jgi:hypothetical protein